MAVVSRTLDYIPKLTGSPLIKPALLFGLWAILRYVNWWEFRLSKCDPARYTFRTCESSWYKSLTQRPFALYLNALANYPPRAYTTCGACEVRCCKYSGIQARLFYLFISDQIHDQIHDQTTEELAASRWLYLCTCRRTYMSTLP